MKKLIIPVLLLASIGVNAQSRMTPEMLWSLKRVSGEGISPNGDRIYYAAKQYDWHTEKSSTKHYVINTTTGEKREYSVAEGKDIVQRDKNVWYATDGKTLFSSQDNGKTWRTFYSGLQDAENIKVSPNGRYIAFSKDVMVTPVLAKDIFPDLPKSTMQVYNDLMYRHWDTWEDGKFSHVFIADVKKNKAIDIMADEPYDCPQKPFGGPEDMVWRPNSKGLVYVCKKKTGKAYAISTNTDLYYYDVVAHRTVNWTAGMDGYDTQPAFSPDGRRIAWLSMAHDGYESDKNNIMVAELDAPSSAWKINVTDGWDGTVDGFSWVNNGNIYFSAPWKGTQQLFEAYIPGDIKQTTRPEIRQATEGQFDITGIVGEGKDEMIVTRCDMNHANEIYAVNRKDGSMHQVTHENDDIYNSIKMGKVEMRKVTLKDGKKMATWVIYPPDFNPHKKYATLLYCQGGPQAEVSQFYSFRWNFQLMAANDYIIVAPNRHGLPGFGTAWNEEISKDWGGTPMQDYLAAIDDVSQESYVDKSRLGCIGASYGGYSVYMLAGMHEGRFKTFIAHDGLFDLKSWYGTTEELWFANWDIGGAYWETAAAKSYEKFNPSNFVNKWTAPIMIVQGGIDYRVPVEQGLEAFQAAQLHGIKSRLLYLPNENHWVLHAQNGIAWHREFFNWLKETLH
jgi:dipeptidyl aminopeptidase/acylaminoacyl peptidase